MISLSAWSGTDYVRWFLHICGGILIYVALLYEDEEGKLQSKLEEAWIKLKDKQDASLSKTVIFLRGIAALTGQAFDRLFGKQLFSLRFLIVSLYLALASIFLSLVILSSFKPNPKLGSLSGNLILFFMFAIVALAPAFIESTFFRVLWWLAALAPLLRIIPFLIFVAATRGLAFTARGTGYASIPFAVSSLCDLSFIVITRLVLRRISRINRVYNIVFMGFANVAILAIVMLAPVYAGLALGKYSLQLEIMMIISLLLNSIDLVVASSALIVALLLLLDRFIWCAILRPLYAAQRFRVIKNKKLLWGAGLALIFLPTNITAELIRSLLARS